MSTPFARFLKDQSGVTGIEYGLIAFGVALVLISAAGAAGEHLKVLYRIAWALSGGGPSIHH